MNYEEFNKGCFEEAKRLYKTANAEQRYVLEKLFPELKESEDNIVINALISGINGLLKTEYHLKGIGGISFNRIIDWLKNQGKKDEEILVLKDQIESLNAAIKAIKETHRIELKKKGEQKSAAWSEEDEYCRYQLIVFCENCMQQDSGAIRCANWLKSIKERVGCKVNCTTTKKWKPSDEQIEALESATENCAYSEYQDCLRDLIKQLKKLKEEAL